MLQMMVHLLQRNVIHANYQVMYLCPPMFWFWPISRGQSIYIGDRERNVANHGDAKVGEEIRHPQSPPIYPCICESLMGG